MARGEQLSTHRPHPVHFAGSITVVLGVTFIAPTGQSPTQAPHDMQL